MKIRQWILGMFALLLILSWSDSLVLAQDGGSPASLPSAFKLDLNKLRHEYQDWNNCGPTTITMSLAYFGYQQDQYPAAAFLKPHYEDKNVNPDEMVAFVNESASLAYNVRALYRPGGDFTLLKTLLANDFPVIIEEGYQPEGYDWMGHYLLLIGYDDNEGVFYSYDSFAGHGNYQGRKVSYADVETFWWHFNNLFIVVYAPEREAELMGLLGERADMVKAYQMAFNTAQARASQNQDDQWAWFNAGDALAVLGYYPQAADFFTIAFQKKMPWRTLWYRHTPFSTFYQLGKFNTVVRLVEEAKLTTPYVEEFHYWHGMVFASQGRIADAKAQFGQALRYNERHQPSRDAITALDNGTFVAVLQQD
jgi:tetratricopeptide (TPR) repeat protein